MDYIKELAIVEAEIEANESPTVIALIKQTFIVWYLLVEGDDILQEDYLQKILNRNTELIKKYYPNEPKLLFLQGWMIQVSHWHFNLEDEVIGEKYLRLAYKHNSDNPLFQWALRENINISKDNLGMLKMLIINNFEQYYVDYEPIKNYFINIVKGQN